MGCRLQFNALLRTAAFAFATLVLLTASVAAQTYFVAPTGDDGNDCSSPAKSCVTFQRAIDLCPPGGHCGILAAPGHYSQKTNVFYYKVIDISPVDLTSKCTDRSAVTVDDHDSRSGQTAIFWVQDHAILTITCLTLAAYRSGTIGFSSRQFAIGDVNYVDFLGFPGGDDVVAAQTSRINLLSPGARGDAQRFAVASDLSQVHVGGNVEIANGLKFDVAFLSSVSGSVVGFEPDTIIGGAGMSGASYQCVDAALQTTATWLPGGNVPYSGNRGCQVSGPLPGNAATISEQLGAIQTDMGNLASAVTAIRAHIEAMELHAQEQVKAVTAIRADIEATEPHAQEQVKAVTAIRADIEAMELHAQKQVKQDHKRDIIMLVAFGMLLAGNAGSIWWVRRR